MPCRDDISFPSSVPSTGYGVGGAGGGFTPFPFDITAPDSRVFICAGINQTTLSPGIAMYPTSEDFAMGSSPYVTGSSQFYTVGSVSWLGATRTQGVDWELVSPFSHIVRILNAPPLATTIRLHYTRWDIGVTAGFEVVSYPVDFSFTKTSIIAEDGPPPNHFFTVNFLGTRLTSNPQTFFSIYPLIVDDMLITHTLYDNPTGFETYRPTGYVVLDLTLMQTFEWNGTSWAMVEQILDGTKFYVKRKQAIYENSSGTAVLVYLAGDGPNIAIPQALTYPPFGEGIGKNLLVDAFAFNASIDFPAAYEVRLSPGDFDPWANS